MGLRPRTSWSTVDQLVEFIQLVDQLVSNKLNAFNNVEQQLFKPSRCSNRRLKAFGVDTHIPCIRANPSSGGGKSGPVAGALPDG